MKNLCLILCIIIGAITNDLFAQSADSLTSNREPILIINGFPYESKAKVSAKELSENYKWTQEIISQEFPDLAEYGIKDVSILKEIPIRCHSRNLPSIIIETDVPYYRMDDLVGQYEGKCGKLKYELILNEDSTYIFKQIRTVNKKTALPSVFHNSGKWNVFKGKIYLNSSNALEDVLSFCHNDLGNISIHINEPRKLTMPRQTWGNKKSINLRRQRDETDKRTI